MNTTSINLFAIFLFLLLTVTYWILQWFVVEKPNFQKLIENIQRLSIGKEASNSLNNLKSGTIVLFVIYFVITYLFQGLWNFILGKNNCGGYGNVSMAFASATPLFLLVLFYILLKLFSSWKQPFSNTFGYLAVKKYIVQPFLDLMPNNKKQKIIREVYEDPALLINEITKENFPDFMKRVYDFNGIQSDEGKNSFFNKQKKNIEKLLTYVYAKENLSSIIWLFLIGVVSILLSFNYMTVYGCKMSDDDKRKHIQNTKKKLNTQKPAETKRVYNVRS